MSFGIIIKNGTNHFVPHFNRTMGRYYGDKKEYLSDLKSKGMEPYNPDNVKRPEKKKYAPSQWARDIVKAGERAGGMNGAIHKELKTVQMKRVPKELKDAIKAPKGGWF